MLRHEQGLNSSLCVKLKGGRSIVYFLFANVPKKESLTV